MTTMTHNPKALTQKKPHLPANPKQPLILLFSLDLPSHLCSSISNNILRQPPFSSEQTIVFLIPLPISLFSHILFFLLCLSIFSYFFLIVFCPLLLNLFSVLPFCYFFPVLCSVLLFYCLILFLFFSLISFSSFLIKFYDFFVFILYYIFYYSCYTYAIGRNAIHVVADFWLAAMNRH